MQAIGQRIAIIGTSGSGKTYVARALADKLAIPYVCNDSLIWGPHWTPVPREVRLARFQAALGGDAWTFDGNVGSLRSPEDRHVVERADTLVWLDLPRRTVWPQVFYRTVRRAWTGEQLWHGNRETFRQSLFSRDSILWWSVKTFNRRRRQYAALFADPAYARLRRIRLTSRRELTKWLAGIRMDVGSATNAR